MARPSPQASVSRIESARRRIRVAKVVLATVIVAVFGGLGLGFRAEHPGADAVGAGTATQSGVDGAATDGSFFGGSDIAPATGTPQASTRTS